MNQKPLESSKPYFLEVYLRGKIINSMVLNETSLFRLGRNANCQLILPDLQISREHCLIRYRDSRWTIENQSSNPIFCEDSEVPSSSFPIKLNSFYQLSPLYSIRLTQKEDSSLAQKTLIRDRRKTKLAILQAKADQITFAEASLQFKDAFGETITYRMDSDTVSIGQHPSNELVLSDPSVSQFHARIELRSNSFLLTDLASTNGSSVEDLPVTQCFLQKETELMFGRAKVRFKLEKKEQTVKAKQHDSFFGMLSQSEIMRKVFSLAEVAAPTEAPIFVTGETGTGKELLAQAIHELSRRYDKELVILNCASLPANLIESELFGHEKGSFTSASETRLGAFEVAHLGTLFLDEIGELSLDLQAKLLRVLESGEIKRIGSNRRIQTDVRIIAATHRDLPKMVEQGKFREDLYFRLHVVPIQIPPLRERKEDIEILINHFLKQLASPLSISPDALEFLQAYNFPGNIRELKNLVQRALIEYQMRKTFHDPLETPFVARLEKEDFRFLRVDGKHLIRGELDERQMIYDCLESHEFSLSLASRELGMAVSSLHDRLKRLDINLKEEKRKLRKEKQRA